MRFFLLYFMLVLGAYLCQTVLYPVFLIPELRIDLFLVVLLHFSFFYERSKTIILALFLGLLMDVGLPLRGCFYPLIYIAIALMALMLRQNLNLHSRRYQALFLGFCTLFEGFAIRMILALQDAGFAEAGYFLTMLAWRTLITALVGPLLMAALEQLDQYFTSFNFFAESRDI